MTNRAERKVWPAETAEPKPSEQAVDDAGGAPSFTARMQHEHLEAALKGWEIGAENPEGSEPEIVPVEEIRIAPLEAKPSAAPEPKPPARSWQRLTALKTSTIIKSAVALLAALVLGWMPVQRLLATTSTEAVINARVITVRTPIAGDVSAPLANLQPGTNFHSGDVLLTVKNPRSDRSNLDSLKRAVEQFSTTIAALRAKEAVLKNHRAELAAQQDRFRSGRVATIEKQISEVDAQIASANVEHKDADKTLARSRALFAKGTAAEAILDKAQRDESVAAQTINQLRERHKALEIELAAARQGTFIADGYNDMPQSAQRGLEIELQLADVSARLAGTIKERAAAKDDLAREARRDRELSTAVIRASVSGRIWETMTAPGEYVNAGQPLMRVLDCGSAIVTASVSEGVFQKLAIGQRATFKPSDGGQPLKGWIVDVSGLAAGPSNDAIQSKLLSGDPYHVTLKFPDLAQRANCQISRAGLVTFDTVSNPVESATVRIGDAK